MTTHDIDAADAGSVDPFAVSTIEIFSDLALPARQHIAAKIRARHYSAGQFILSNATVGRDVYFLIDGAVRVCAYSANGKQVQFEDLLPGKMFGEIAALDGGTRTSDCIAVKKVIAGSMAHTDFYALLAEFPDINRAVLLRLTSMLRRHMERVFEFSTAPVAARVRFELLRLGSVHETGQTEVTIHNPPTHADIAARISTHREAVTKEMRNLERKGVITWSRSCCIIHRVEALVLE